MTETALWLDGNALAGLLAELFGADMTTALRRCPGCGTRSAVGAHRVYRGAGIVMRCPECAQPAMRIAALRDRHVVQFTGAWTVEFPDGL